MMDSPYILRILEVFQDKFKYYIVTELLKGITLMDYVLKAPDKALNERMIARYMKQILSGLTHCHSKGVIHRDIRPENVIFVDKHYKFLKLADFKFARIESEKEQKLQNTLCPPAYIAPEVIQKREYSSKSDIWSCGILGCFLLSGRLPYEVTSNLSLTDLLMIIQSNKFTLDSFKSSEWSEITVGAKQFLLRMLQLDPADRADAKDLLNDLWLSNSNTAPLDSNKRKAYLENITNSIVISLVNL
jgi:calcium-dependent protein kinase